MLSLHIPWGSGSQHSDRVEQEKRRVVVPAYIYAYKKEGDHDYHVIIGDAPDAPDRQFINSEISALPVSGTFRPLLKDVRDKFKTFFDIGNVGPEDYQDVQPPLPVRITGSLFFDMDHSPPREYVGHNDFDPKTPWEIHPITDIQFETDQQPDNVGFDWQNSLGSPFSPKAVLGNPGRRASAMIREPSRPNAVTALER
jgi:hypothetical protein